MRCGHEGSASMMRRLGTIKQKACPDISYGSDAAILDLGIYWKIGGSSISKGVPPASTPQMPGQLCGFDCLKTAAPRGRISAQIASEKHTHQLAA